MSIKRNIQKGFNLLEVLVALVVLSIGLLGIVAMVTNSIRFADTALLQSQAVMLAYDMAEKVRANQLEASNYVTAFTDAVATVDCYTSVCTSENIAQEDLSHWKNRLSATLPSGQGSVAVTAGTPTSVTISVQWSDRAKEWAGGGTVKLGSYSFVMAL